MFKFSKQWGLSEMFCVFVIRYSNFEFYFSLDDICKLECHYKSLTVGY
jgi:hypothetical protein